MNNIGPNPQRSTRLFVSGLLCCILAAIPVLGGALIPTNLEVYRHQAMVRQGDPARGMKIFGDEQRTGCSRCHTVDGKGGKAGPDLFAVGDKFGRREIVESVLAPSATIAVGYSTTTLETKSGEDYTGIIRQATDAWIELMGADAKLVRVATADIQYRRTSEVSLMPEGLQGGLTPEDFADLIEYLVSLKQPESAAMVEHGMPAVIPQLDRPVAFRSMFAEELKFEHPVWVGPVPGESNVFLVVEHESGKIWRLEMNKATSVRENGSQSSDLKTSDRVEPSKALFAELGAYQPGTRGLLGLALHPRFRENRKYYFARHLVEGVRFATVIFEREAAQPRPICGLIPENQRET